MCAGRGGEPCCSARRCSLRLNTHRLTKHNPINTNNTAAQTRSCVAGFARHLSSPPVASACLVGGVDKGPQIKALAAGAEVVTGTPGRMLDLFESGKLPVDQVRRVCVCGFVVCVLLCMCSVILCCDRVVCLPVCFAPQASSSSTTTPINSIQTQTHRHLTI